MSDIEEDLDVTLTWASMGGYVDIVEKYLNKGASAFEDALYHASLNNQIEVIKCLLKRTKISDQILFNSIVKGASYGNNFNIIQMFESEIIFTIKIVSDGLIEAAKGGHIEIMKYFISTNDRWMDSPLNSGHLTVDDFNKALETAKCHIDILEYLIELGANPIYHIPQAIKCGDINMINYLINTKLVGTNLDHRSFLIQSVKTGKLNTVKHICSIFNLSIDDYNTALIYAAYHGYFDVCEYLIFMGADNYDFIEKAALNSGHKALSLWLGTCFFQKRYCV